LKWDNFNKQRRIRYKNNSNLILIHFEDLTNKLDKKRTNKYYDFLEFVSIDDINDELRKFHKERLFKFTMNNNIKNKDAFFIGFACDVILSKRNDLINKYQNDYKHELKALGYDLRY
jgi:hypothetical protein